jgi:hypothetical protein
MKWEMMWIYMKWAGTSWDNVVVLSNTCWYLFFYHLLTFTPVQNFMPRWSNTQGHTWILVLGCYCLISLYLPLCLLKCTLLINFFSFITFFYWNFIYTHSKYENSIAATVSSGTQYLAFLNKLFFLMFFFKIKIK